MKALRSFLVGLRVGLTSPRLALTLWLANLLLALVLAGIFFSGILGESFEYSTLVEGHQNFDWVAWVDFRQNQAGLLSQLTQLSGWLVFFGVLLHVFLSGGVLEILDTPKRRFSLEGLCRGGAHRFPAFFGLVILELGLLWALDLGWNRFLADWVKDHWTADLTDERWYLATILVQGGLFVLFFYVVRTAFDYARVRTVVENRSSFILAAVAGWRFFLRHLFSASLLAVLVGLGYAVVVAATVLLEPWIQGPGWIQVLLLFLFHQAYVLARVGVRITDYAAKVELVRTFRQAEMASLALPTYQGPPPMEGLEDRAEPPESESEEAGD